MAITSSLLPVIDACDNFSLPSYGDKEAHPEEWAPLLLRDPIKLSSKQFPLGFLRSDIVELIQKDPEQALVSCVSVTSQRKCICFAPALDSREKRSQAIQRLVQTWIDAGLFSEITGGRMWRGELYAVYTNPFGPLVESNIAFDIERSAAALFGVVTYGVHMTMFFDDQRDNLRVWVPTRSHTKQTWPGYLDNSVAGGIPSGLSPLETIVKECEEEASLDESEVRKRIKAVGCVSYLTKTKHDFLQPEIQFVYDLKLETGGQDRLQPRPSDGEVDSFELCELHDCLQKMRAGRFKPNCALVLVDFLIRNGYLTPEDEPHYFEIMTRLHGKMGFECIY